MMCPRYSFDYKFQYTYIFTIIVRDKYGDKMYMYVIIQYMYLDVCLTYLVNESMSNTIRRIVKSKCRI